MLNHTDSAVTSHIFYLPFKPPTSPQSLHCQAARTPPSKIDSFRHNEHGFANPPSDEEEAAARKRLGKLVEVPSSLRPLPMLLHWQWPQVVTDKFQKLHHIEVVGFKTLGTAVANPLMW